MLGSYFSLSNLCRHNFDWCCGTFWSFWPFWLLCSFWTFAIPPFIYGQIHTFILSKKVIIILFGVHSCHLQLKLSSIESSPCVVLILSFWYKV